MLPVSERADIIATIAAPSIPQLPRWQQGNRRQAGRQAGAKSCSGRKFRAGQGSSAAVQQCSSAAVQQWGDRRDSNPRQPESQSGALPTELRPPTDSLPDRQIAVLTAPAEIDWRTFSVGYRSRGWKIGDSARFCQRFFTADPEHYFRPSKCRALARVRLSSGYSSSDVGTESSPLFSLLLLSDSASSAGTLPSACSAVFSCSPSPS